MKIKKQNKKARDNGMNKFRDRSQAREPLDYYKWQELASKSTVIRALEDTCDSDYSK